MGKILAVDSWKGEPTRLYVAYPDRGEAEKWETDPILQTWLEKMRGGRTGVKYDIGVGWGYPHYPTDDYVITIARLG